MGSLDDKKINTENIQDKLNETTVEDTALKGISGGSGDALSDAAHPGSTFPTTESNNTISRMFEWRTIKDLFD